MKQFLFSFCMLLLPMLCHSQNPTALVVWHKDGSCTEMAFKDKPSVKFGGEKVVLESEGTSVEFDRSELLRITYGQEGAKVASPEKETLITVSHGELVLRHVATTTPISVYGITGQSVSVKVRRQTDNVWISLADLSKGVYVIKVGDRNFKYSKP